MASGINGLTSELFKDGGPALAIGLTGILARVWETDMIPSDWCRFCIVSVYKEKTKVV